MTFILMSRALRIGIAVLVFTQIPALVRAQDVEAAASGSLSDQPLDSSLKDSKLLGLVVQPGERARATWRVSESFAGAVLDTPVFVSRGAEPGPTLCLTAGIHGDELNGVEIVRRALEAVDPKKLTGTLIGVPIVNLHGFRRSSRYLPDRRDLNRYFPGREKGSSASRIAHAFFRDVVGKCDRLIDLHTGSFHRTNVPHIRANLDNPAAAELAQGFGTSIVIHSEGTPGTLRRAATESGIVSITYEAGEPMRFSVDDVDRGVDGILNVMRSTGMLAGERRGQKSEVFRRSHWVRCDDGGILLAAVELGQRVETGQLLGTVTDPILNEKTEIRAPHKGTVIGKALNQVVMPGFAAFNLGIREGDSTGLPDGNGDWSIEGVEDEQLGLEETPE